MKASFQFLRNRFDPDALFLVTDKREYTYRDLVAYARLLESQLPEHRPIKVVFPAHRSERTVLVIASCWMLDIPVIPLSPNMDDREWQRVIHDLKPDVIFIDPAVRHSFPNTDIVQVQLPGAHSLGKQPQPLQQLVGDPEHLFGFFMTSGTSGPSKIVPLKRRQFLWGAEGSAQNFKPESGELWLLSLPLHHVGGVSIILRSMLYGSGVYLLSEFKADVIRRLLANDKRIRFCSLVPTMLRRVLEDSGFQPHSEFTICLLGGGPMSVELVREANRHNMAVATSFGMTETAAQIAAHVYHSHNIPGKLTAGKIFPPNKAELRDEQGNRLLSHNEGILWIQGPQVFDGYYDRELNTRYIDSQGWFCTGDHSKIDSDGEIEILMRRTDRIVTGGENVNPIEIEQILLEHPDITESAVFGLPDDEWGQRVVALVVRNADNEFIPDLSDYLSSHLRGYQIPKEIIFVSDLPYTSTGKLDRSRLHEWFKKS